MNMLQAVKSKELDMKGAAELLGVSYGTLYGRYRENFGYLKHAWNISGRPQKKANLFSDPGTKAVLDSLRAGHMNVKQAAEALGMDPGMLAYQLAGKVSIILCSGAEPKIFIFGSGFDFDHNFGSGSSSSSSHILAL